MNVKVASFVLCGKNFMLPFDQETSWLDKDEIKCVAVVFFCYIA